VRKLSAEQDPTRPVSCSAGKGWGGQEATFGVR